MSVAFNYAYALDSGCDLRVLNIDRGSPDFISQEVVYTVTM
ncbi:MAG: hypothetical protein ACTJLM_05325 [Ehrlichia sp.]